MRILAVDDEPDVVDIIAHVLRDAGHTVRIGRGGADALQALEDEPFDLVITDLQMPAVSGHEVVRAARDRSGETVIVVVTAECDTETERSLRVAGASDVLYKPMSLSRLEEVVSQASAQSRRRKPSTQARGPTTDEARS